MGTMTSFLGDLQHYVDRFTEYHIGTLLLTWFNFNPNTKK